MRKCAPESPLTLLRALAGSLPSIEVARAPLDSFDVPVDFEPAAEEGEQIAASSAPPADRAVVLEPPPADRAVVLEPPPATIKLPLAPTPELGAEEPPRPPAVTAPDVTAELQELVESEEDALESAKRPKAVPPPAPKRKPEKKPETKPERPSETPRVRSWWEELFTDDFVRSMDRLTDPQIKKEVKFIEESLAVQKGGIMLDLGCGTGQHAVELAARGYSVVGYDRSLTMLALAADEAQGRGQKLNLLQGDMREMAFDEMFDGVFSWSTSFGYFDSEKNLDVLRRVHRALRLGGMFLLDIVNRDYVGNHLPSLSWYEGDGCVCMDDAHFDPITSRLIVKRTLMLDDGRAREMEFTIRLFCLHEIGKMLHDVGFKVVEVSGHPATAGVFMGPESPRVITLAERR